jgi:hypothetical protein
VGVFEVDTAAVRVVSEWIKTIPKIVSTRKTIARRAAANPVIHGDMLLLPEGTPGKVVLTGIDGRRHDLVRTSGRSYRIPGTLPTGIYLLKLGTVTFKLSL